jgi:peptidoglycan hydrolase CwlO-like protein
MRRTLTALVLALLPLGAAAQGTPVPVDGMAAELAKVNATLKEIAALLGKQSDLQSLDLLIKRVQLSESQVAEHERRLRIAQSELQRLEDERSNHEMRIQMFNERFKRGDTQEADQIELMVTQMENELKRNRQRTAQVTQEIATLQGDLGPRRDDLRSWQSILDRRLARISG